MVMQDPKGNWVILSDRLNTHQSESLVRLVAEHEGLNEELGVKGKEGILKNMKSRAAFLSDSSHKIRFIYTPRHASWINQIEIWFSILGKKLLKQMNYTSTPVLASFPLGAWEKPGRFIPRRSRWRLFTPTDHESSHVPV
jgi:putative transposase